MNTKSRLRRVFVLAVVLSAAGLSVYSLATPALSQQSIRIPQQQVGVFAYAQLTIQGNEQVTWDEGGNDVPRVDTLDATYRRLGGNQRTSVVNLLNVVGGRGWELVQVSNNTWTFKRRM